MLRRPVYEYDVAKGPEVYRHATWRRPDAPPLAMTIEQADAIPAYVQLAEPQLFKQGKIEAIVDPRRLQYGVLERADILVFQMIRDNAGKRPIYISRTAGNYGDMLGLSKHLLIQGLAEKVMPDPITPSRDTLLLEGLGYVDVPRSKALWRDVYRGPAAVIARNDWVDRASVGIAGSYVTTGLILAESLSRNGDDAGAQSAATRARQVAVATRIDKSFFGPVQAPQPVIGGDAAPRVRVPASKR
jgi:hypothetical protein